MLQNINDYFSTTALSKGLNYLVYPLSFFSLRIISKYNNNDNLRTRIIEGSIISGFALLTEILVENKVVNSYSYSYAPLIFSYSYNNLPIESKAIKTSASAGIIILAKNIYDYNLWHYFLPSALTCFACFINKAPNNMIILYSSLSFLDEIIINSGLNEYYNHHYLTLISISTSITSRIDFLNPLLKTSIGIGLGTIGAVYEEPIRKYLFPKDSFVESYKILSQLVHSKEDFNKLLEYSFILGANLEVFIGLFGNYLASEENLKNGKLATLSHSNPDSINSIFKEFELIAFKYVISIVPFFVISKILTETLGNLLYFKIIFFIEQDFIHHVVLEKNNFLSISKESKSSLEDYLNNIEIIVAECQTMLEEVITSIAKLSSIGSLSNLSSWQLPLIIFSDGIISIFFEALEKLKQYHLSEAQICSSKLDKISQNDMLNSLSLMQSDHFQNLHSKWDQSYFCKFYNEKIANLIHSTILVIQDNYTKEILSTFFQYLSAILFKFNKVAKHEIFLSARILQTTTNCLLFKTKHRSNFARVNRNNEYLNSLLKIINNNNNSNVNNIEISIKPEHGLLIDHLHFERGLNERKISLNAQNLLFEKGQSYLIIDSNAGGKTSFLSLLYFRIYSIRDDSFYNVSGNISYPSSKVKIIPQKNYCDLNHSLLDKIISNEEFTNLIPYQQNEIIKNTTILLNKLNFLGKKKEINPKLLSDVKEDWCSELSNGQLKKLLIVSAIVNCPDLLIMDETLDSLDKDSKKTVYKLLKNNNCPNHPVIISTSHNHLHNNIIEKNFFDHYLCINEGNIEFCGVNP